MNLDELCKLLVEHGLVDMEKLRLNFTERIMREGGGVPVLQNQEADIIANINTLGKGVDECIRSYSPEKVELYFYLQELANQARVLFYKGANETLKKRNSQKEKPRPVESDKVKFLERLRGLESGFYKSSDIGGPIELKAISVGHFLSHLSEDERKDLRIRYFPNERKWEKY